MGWACYNPVAAHGGRGVRTRLKEFLPRGNALLVTTEGMVRRGGAKALMDSCPETTWSAQTVPPNPDLDMLDTIRSWHMDAPISTVVALGGGSAMDSAKALAAILPMSGPAPLSGWLRDGTPREDVPVLPLICLPTTSGTGAEATPFGTIWDTACNKKRSVAHPDLYPRTVLLDPELTLSLPWTETLFGALDALSHCLETLWNKTATPVSTALAVEAVSLVRRGLPAVKADLGDIQAREILQQASFLAGLAISQSRTALAHAISYPVTLTFGVPHGLACAFTLPAIALRVDQAGAWPAGQARGAAMDAVSLLADCGLPGLMRDYCKTDDVAALVDQMFDPDRADNLVIPLGRTDVLGVLRDSMA